MTTVNFSKIVVWITIIQFLFTMAFYWYTFTKLSQTDPLERDKTFAAKTDSYVKGLDISYTEKMARYEKTIDSIQAKSFATEIMLSKAKAASKRDSELVEHLLKQQWDTLSQKQKLIDCDTLRELTEKYLQTSQKKDSTYEERIRELKDETHVLSQQVETCDTTKERLENKLELSLNQLKASNKEIKKQKRRKNFLKVTSFVLAGLGIYLVAH